MATREAPRVLVIGAGAIGAVVAHALARDGAAVTIVERVQPGSGVSAATFSIDVTPRKTPRSYFDFGVRARDAHRHLAEEVGGSWMHDCARLEWADEPSAREHLLAQLRRLREWGYAAERVTAEEARELEPQLAHDAPAERMWAYMPESAWYDPQEMARRLLERACERGASLVCGEEIVGCRLRHDRLEACVARSGLVLPAEQVVICGGPQAAELAAALGSPLALLQVPGMVAVTRPSSTPLRSILVSAGVGVRPHHGSRALLHSYAVDARLETGGASAAELAEALLRDARSAVEMPVGVQELRRGVRPLPPDGLPIAGRLPGVSNAHVAVTHSGAHLAPLLGSLVAAEVLGEAQSALASYRPERASEQPGTLLDEASRLMVQRLAEAESGSAVR